MVAMARGVGWDGLARGARLGEAAGASAAPPEPVGPWIWHKPTHQSVPYPSHSTVGASTLLSSQFSHSILSSRLATVISSSSTYVRRTWQGVCVGCPRRSFQRSSHSCSIESWIAGERSFFMYRSRRIAVASISQCLATWPTRLHAAH
jgi:hypothetical protein